MRIDSFILAKGRQAFTVVVSTMDRCPHRLYEVFHKDTKIFGVFDRPDFDYCQMRLRAIPLVHQDWKHRHFSIR